ncbi:MAG: hypothetical protein ABEJ74_04265 [Haloferacaceae archaeon]
MRRRTLQIGCVVCLLLLAGCSGLTATSGSDAGTTTPAATESTPTATPTATPTPKPTATPTPTPTPKATTAASEEWSLPEYPNDPFEDKTAEDTLDNHIKSMEVVGEGSGDGGYSSVELAVTANTSMERVDPAKHGTVDGEPFLIAYIDGHLVETDEGSRYNVDAPPVQRSDELRFDENKETTLEIPKAAFEATGTEPGEVSILVLLLDEDKTWDDIYGRARVTVTYDPNA